MAQSFVFEKKCIKNIYDNMLAIKKAVIGLNKGKSRLISTAVYGRTIFWRTTR